MPAVPASFIEPLWVQFYALLPERGPFDPAHPLGTHRRRIGDRIVFDKLVQVLAFGCSYVQIADSTCSATTLRTRRDEWITLGVFAQLKQIVTDAYDRMVGLELPDVAVDGCITKAPGGGEVAGPSPVDRRKQGMKRSICTTADGIPLGRALIGANRHDSVVLADTLDALHDLRPLPGQITVHLDAGYDSAATRAELTARGLGGQIACKGIKAPVQASQRWPVERTNAWHNAFNRLQRCYERRKIVINAYCDLADAIIVIRRLIRRAWTSHRWDPRPTRRPGPPHRLPWTCPVVARPAEYVAGPASASATRPRRALPGRARANPTCRAIAPWSTRFFNTAADPVSEHMVQHDDQRHPAIGKARDKHCRPQRRTPR